MIDNDVITIDGPAASGKSSVGKAIADFFGYLFFDTGLMYRAVSWAAIQAGLDIRDEEAISFLAEQIDIKIYPASIPDGRMYDVIVDEEDVTWQIRSPAVNSCVSQISTYERVRSAMTAKQREMGKQGKIVMVGRDIGTVVMPNAKFKFYLEATAEERAKRRCMEIVRKNGEGVYKNILQSIKGRDQIDSSREIAPLKPARDANIINTDGKTFDEVVNEVISIIKIKKPGG
ncbi:MAG TPA: (d)CMP kinase [Anaerolineae bacterium]|nr:(d)CMP kinase [Anaerolineae bacterium]